MTKRAALGYGSLALLLGLAWRAGACQDIVVSSKFDCTRRPKGWGAFLKRPEGPELVACFGGLMLSEDNEKACKATLPVIGEGYYYCAEFQ